MSALAWGLCLEQVVDSALEPKLFIHALDIAGAGSLRMRRMPWLCEVAKRSLTRLIGLPSSRCCFKAPVADDISRHQAHGDWSAKHGGLKNVDGGEVLFELVARGRDVVMHLEDRGEPISAVGARAVLKFARADSTTTFALRSSGGNRLSGRAPSALLKGDRLVAKLNFPIDSIAEGQFHIN